MSAVMIADQLEIPLSVRSLRDFRRWMRSQSFPDSGRIDYIGGNIEVDMSPEQFFSHGGPKTALAQVLAALIHSQKLGYLRIDRMRFVNRQADLSCEPDLVFVTYDSVQSKRVRMIPDKKGRPDSCLELEGAVDLVVEIISQSSVAKDTQRLPKAYFSAGVKELWLVDARDDENLVFKIHRRGKSGFLSVRSDPNGFLKSEVVCQSFRLNRERDRLGYWEFELQPR
jgi:Uma2 family endonuclease